MDPTTSPADTRRKPEPLDAQIGMRIRLRRRNLKITQQGLGQRLGITFQQIQKYERGSNRVSASMLARVATALDCTAGFLIGDENRPVGPDPLSHLNTPDAVKMLEAFSSIDNPALRRQILDFVAGLARTWSPGSEEPAGEEAAPVEPAVKAVPMPAPQPQAESAPRRRGRPPKVRPPVETETLAVAAEPAVADAPRRRGRPPKQSAPPAPPPAPAAPAPAVPAARAAKSAAPVGRPKAKAAPQTAAPPLPPPPEPEAALDAAEEPEAKANRRVSRIRDRRLGAKAGAAGRLQRKNKRRR